MELQPNGEHFMKNLVNKKVWVMHDENATR